MAQSMAPLIKFLGFNSQGDLGPYTVYTSRSKRLVFFPRAPPLVPASIEQRTQRAKFSAGALMWKSLSQATRDKWTALGRAAGLRITGFNLFTYAQATGDWAAVQTLIARTGINPCE
jgi:hypothetical protein